MSALAAPVEARHAARAGPLLVVGIMLACLTEALAGSVLALGRVDIIGDTHATPDEFAWLDIGYVALKLFGFLLAPWVIGQLRESRVIIGATLVMGLACLGAAFTTDLSLLVALRGVQGLSGGLLLVATQTLLFLAYPRLHQPILQALFAMAAVVAPATLAPALQGWLLDTYAWTWVFFMVVPLALAAVGTLLLAGITATPRHVAPRPLDGIGAALAATLLLSLTYVLVQGHRWDWWEATHIVAVSALGLSALLLLVARQLWVPGRAFIDTSIFSTEDFSFAFVVSFVAGAALFGSGYLIPSFAVAVLGFTLTDAGQLLLPSGGLFVVALLLAAYLMQVRRVPPVATVPLGILLIMLAMWMLSSANRESGSDDMMVPILLRGFGLGMLFLSITLIAFSNLPPRNLATGIGVFNAGRQIGGLMGVAGLQTHLDNEVATNVTTLAASLTAGGPALGERLARTTAYFASQGMDAVSASRAALGLLGRSVGGQASVIAFESAFVVVALLFVVAAPIIVAIKITLAKVAHRRAINPSLPG